MISRLQLLFTPDKETRSRSQNYGLCVKPGRMRDCCLAFALSFLATLARSRLST